MFGIFRRARRANKVSLRHQLSIENRLETRCVMSTAALVGGTLTIVGSEKADLIDVSLDPSGTVYVSQYGQPFAKFNQSEIGLIRIYGLGGDDRVSISGDLGAAAIIDGGAGDDSLSVTAPRRVDARGIASVVLLGGEGADTLTGGEGRDILIGGQGNDTLRGGGDDDILVGGSLDFQQKADPFPSILKVWNAPDDYETRIKMLNDGSNGFTPFSKAVMSEKGTDVLMGEAGRDAFFMGEGFAKLGDQSKDEAVM